MHIIIDKSEMIAKSLFVVFGLNKGAEPERSVVLFDDCVVLFGGLVDVAEVCVVGGLVVVVAGGIVVGVTLPPHPYTIDPTCIVVEAVNDIPNPLLTVEPKGGLQVGVPVRPSPVYVVQL